MTNAELIQKIRAEIGRLMEESDFDESANLYSLLSFLSTLESEKPMNKDCNGCPHCVDRKDQYGWHFKGCFGGPYNGKFIAEIDECPLKQGQPEVDSEKPAPADLEEAAEKYATEWHKNPDGSAWKPYFEVSAIKAFIAGAKWDRQQMLNDAVEGIVHYFGETQGVPRSITIPQMQKWLKPFNDGDKVKLIIVKEKDNGKSD